MHVRATHPVVQSASSTLISEVKSGDATRRAAALEILAKRFWPPVYARLRAGGKSQDEAADLTQAFFADVVLSRRLFEQADLGRASLQSLLFIALRRFETDQYRRSCARLQGKTISFDEFGAGETLLAAIMHLSAQESLDHQWAQIVLWKAIRRCKQVFCRTDRIRHWNAFEERVLHPCLMGTVPVPLVNIAEKVGFESAAQVAAAVQVVKRHLVALLRQVVSEGARRPADSDADFNHFVSLLT